MKKELLIPDTINRNNFDLLRFLLATSVIVCHCFAIYLGWEQFAKLEPFMKWSSGKISIGSAAVNFFFVISGFLIVRSFEYSSSYWQYLKKRILRIYPGFIVVFVLCFLVFGPVGHMKEWTINAYTDFLRWVNMKRELANMLSLQSPVENLYFTQLPQSGLNNSLWTIQYEFICYLTVPILAWLSLKKQKHGLLVAMIVFYVLFCLQSLGYIFPFNQDLSGKIICNPYYYPRFFTYYLCGSCVYIYRDQIPRNTWLAVTSAFIFLLAFKLKLIDVLWPVSGTYLLFYVAYHPVFSFPNFAKYGDFSYGIYLYGWPLQQLVMLNFGRYLNPYTFFVFVFPIVVLFAVLSWKLIEQPALKLKKRVNLNFILKVNSYD
jgi:peptidoglycan/LPS O-acetylase OafA/YrhL